MAKQELALVRNGTYRNQATDIYAFYAFVTNSTKQRKVSKQLVQLQSVRTAH